MNRKEQKKWTKEETEELRKQKEENEENVRIIGELEFRVKQLEEQVRGLGSFLNSSSKVKLGKKLKNEILEELNSRGLAEGNKKWINPQTILPK